MLVRCSCVEVYRRRRPMQWTTLTQIPSSLKGFWNSWSQESRRPESCLGSYMMIFKVRGRRRQHMVRRHAAPVEPCGSYSGQSVPTVENLWRRPPLFSVCPVSWFLPFALLLCGCVCSICVFQVSPSTANVPEDACLPLLHLSFHSFSINTN